MKYQKNKQTKPHHILLSLPEGKSIGTFGNHPQILKLWFDPQAPLVLGKDTEPQTVPSVQSVCVCVCVLACV